MHASALFTANPGSTFRIGGELPVHRLGYGAMRLVGPGAWGEPADPDQCRLVLRRAVELGVNLIDTADAYGPEISERIIAETLAPYPAGLLVTTKGGNTRQGPSTVEPVGRAGYLIQCVHGSLRRLKLERIDLYQLHRIDPRTPLEESLGALVKMREQGKIHHVGLSEVSVKEIEAARRITPIATVQNRYSLGDRRHEAVLDYCEREGIGFMAWYPINAGKLLVPEHPAAPVFRALGEKYQATAAQLSLAWLLARSPVLLPIPGTAKVAHLEENWAATRLPLSAEDCAALAAAAAE